MIAAAITGESIGENAPLVAAQSVHVLVVVRIQQVFQRALEHVGRVFARSVGVRLVGVAGMQIDDLDPVLVEFVAIVLQRVAAEIGQKEIEPHLGASRDAGKG